MKRTTKTNKTKLPADAYDRTPRFTITVTDETCWLTRHDLKGKPASTYPVNVADLGGAFHGFEAMTGLLPPDVLFWQRKAQYERIAIWLPPARREIAWRSGKRVVKLNVPMPGWMFLGAGTQYWIFAAKVRPMAERDELFTAPLPNIHADGMICAGNVAFPPCTLRSIHQAADLFFGSEFNHDLSADKIAPARPHPIARNEVSQRTESLLNFYRTIASSKRFPMQRLYRYRNDVGHVLNIQRQPTTLVDEHGYDYPGLMEDTTEDEMEYGMENEA
jgi:hypothetical protein